MNRFWPILRLATIAAAFGVTSLLAAGASQAATYQIPFSTTGVATTVAIAGGAPGLMSFTLNLGDPPTFIPENPPEPAFYASGVFGNFAMDVFGPGNMLLGRIDLAGNPGNTATLRLFDLDPDPAGPVDFGSIATPGIFGSLPNISLWQLLVAAGETPLSIVVTATLNCSSPFPPFSPCSFTPVLTLETDLTVDVSAVPLPGALALFATGLAAFGLLGRRRKNRMQEAA